MRVSAPCRVMSMHSDGPWVRREQGRLMRQGEQGRLMRQGEQGRLMRLMRLWDHWGRAGRIGAEHWEKGALGRYLELRRGPPSQHLVVAPRRCELPALGDMSLVMTVISGVRSLQPIEACKGRAR